MKDKGIIWATLTDEAKEQLLKAVGGYRYPQHFCHHLTLQFDVSANRYRALIGKKVSLKINGCVHNEIIQAAITNQSALPISS